MLHFETSIVTVILSRSYSSNNSVNLERIKAFVDLDIFSPENDFLFIELYANTNKVKRQ